MLAIRMHAKKYKKVVILNDSVELIKNYTIHE